MKSHRFTLLSLLLILSLLFSLSSCTVIHTPIEHTSVSPDDIPPYSGEPFVVLQNNQPSFTQTEIVSSSYEAYSPLDTFGRCGVAKACLGRDLMPTEPRGSIGSVKPTGWQTVKYDFVDGKYLYNRCHLIGFQLSGENANERNLITGTRYMNTEGMLPFENMVADYIKETGNHVMYRVTPVYDEKNPLATGVQMEAYSVEDAGEGICFHVFCYNVQPGVFIDYSSGKSEMNEEDPYFSSDPVYEDLTADYVLNISSKKVHYPTCSSVSSILDKNKEHYHGTLQSLRDQGYSCCIACFKEAPF